MPPKTPTQRKKYGVPLADPVAEARRQARLARDRKNYNALDEAGKQRHRDRAAKYRQKSRLNETAEQRLQRLAEKREQERLSRLNETDEQKAARIAKNKLYITPEKMASRRQSAKTAMAQKEAILREYDPSTWERYLLHEQQYGRLRYLARNKGGDHKEQFEAWLQANKHVRPEITKRANSIRKDLTPEQINALNLGRKNFGRAIVGKINRSYDTFLKNNPPPLEEVGPSYLHSDKPPEPELAKDVMMPVVDSLKEDL